jgi:hypothetical protein
VKCPHEVANCLGPFYVYVLVDPRPRKGQPFYVGKGRGQRLLNAGIEADKLRDPDRPRDRVESAKIARIREIRRAGYEPRIDVVRHGVRTAHEAFGVESALIDCLPNLTNAIRGQDVEHGREPLTELVARYGAPPLSTSEPLLLIRLRPWIDTSGFPPQRTGYGFRLGMSDRDLYNSTRCWWKVSPNRVEKLGIEHAVAVFQGVTRALYRIQSWEERPTLGRWGFRGHKVEKGKLYHEVIGPFGHRVPFPVYSQNPISYWPR